MMMMERPRNHRNNDNNYTYTTRMTTLSTYLYLFKDDLKFELLGAQAYSSGLTKLTLYRNQTRFIAYAMGWVL